MILDYVEGISHQEWHIILNMLVKVKCLEIFTVIHRFNFVIFIFRKSNVFDITISFVCLIFYKLSECQEVK